MATPLPNKIKIPKPNTKGTLSGKDLLASSDLKLDMKELERNGFGTTDTVTISTAPLEQALKECQSILGQMDTIDSSQISTEVQDIDKSFSNGDFPDKVISFVDKKENDNASNYFSDDLWEISTCDNQDCPQRDKCNLNFTSHNLCIWSIIHCRLNNPKELLSIIREIASYMQRVDKDIGDRIENKSF